jgi:hypothetical protein
MVSTMSGHYGEEMRLPADEVPVEGPGADVGERLRVVQVVVALSYHVPNSKTRQRKGREYPREELPENRWCRLSLTRDALDPQNGPRIIAQAVGQRLYRQLAMEGWPRKVADLENRPGHGSA